MTELAGSSAGWADTGAATEKDKEVGKEQDDDEAAMAEKTAKGGKKLKGEEKPKDQDQQPERGSQRGHHLSHDAEGEWRL